MEPYFTRSKAVKTTLPSSEEGDVEPDDVAPVAATHTKSGIPSSTHFPLVDSEDTSVLEAESMSTEPTGPVSISIPVLHPERGHPAGGGHGLSGPSADRQVAVTLRAPSGHVGPPATTDLFRIDRRTEGDAVTRPGFDISPTTHQ